MVTTMVEPARRTHCFALQSGSMLTGIGSGPIVGKVASYFGLPIQTAFSCAAATAILGGLYFWRMASRDEAGVANRQIVKISAVSAVQVLRSKATFSILMVGLGGAIFGGLGSFQTSYAASLGLDYSLFFLCFMGVAIVCRLPFADCRLGGQAQSPCRVLCLEHVDVVGRGWFRPVCARQLELRRHGGFVGRRLWPELFRD